MAARARPLLGPWPCALALAGPRDHRPRDAPPGRGRSGKENTLKLGPDGTLSKADAKRLQMLLSGKRPKQRKQNKPKKRQFKAAHGCPACAGRPTLLRGTAVP